MPKCLSCNHRIPLSWYVWSGDKTKYRCVNCGALHKWKNSGWHYVYVVLVLLFIIMFSLSEAYISSDILRLLIFGSAILSIRFFMPNLYQLDNGNDA